MDIHDVSFLLDQHVLTICIESQQLRNNLNDYFVNENVVPYARIRYADKEEKSLEIIVVGFVIYHANDFVSA